MIGPLPQQQQEQQEQQEQRILDGMMASWNESKHRVKQYYSHDMTYHEQISGRQRANQEMQNIHDELILYQPPRIKHIFSANVAGDIQGHLAQIPILIQLMQQHNKQVQLKQKTGGNNYYEKYLKYKNKYNKLKIQIG